MSNLQVGDANNVLNQLASASRAMERMAYDTIGGLTPTEADMLEYARIAVQRARQAVNNLAKLVEESNRKGKISA